MDDFLQTIRTFNGALELAPTEGSAFPEAAWGDHFFFFAPDGQVHHHDQPYATVVTKNYPDDTLSELDRPDRWRLNIHVGTGEFLTLTGEQPRAEATSWDYALTDTVLPHPVYRAQGWISIVNPDVSTRELALRLLRQAHDAAERRADRRNLQIN